MCWVKGRGYGVVCRGEGRGEGAVVGYSVISQRLTEGMKRKAIQ